MAMTLDELTQKLKYGSYTPLTEEQIQQKARDKYQSELDASKLTAQQAYDKTALALDNQRAALDQSYAKQTEAARENTARSYSAADRHALSRGMQRSTYNNSTLANINLEGDETLNKLAEALRADQNALDSQKSLAAQQLAQQLAQYENNFNSQVSAYADQLREQDYQKRLEQEKYYNQLQAMLYEYGLQSGSGSRGGGGSTRPKTPPTTDDTTPGTDNDYSLFDLLNNYVPPSTTTKTAGSTDKYANGYTPGSSAYKAVQAQTAVKNAVDTIKQTTDLAKKTKYYQ